MLFAVFGLCVGIWGMWTWAGRLVRARPERRRLVTGVLLGVTLGAGIPLLIATASTLFAFIAARKADASNKATFLAEGISRSLNSVAVAVVVTAAGAVVFLVLE